MELCTHIFYSLIKKVKLITYKRETRPLSKKHIVEGMFEAIARYDVKLAWK